VWAQPADPLEQKRLELQIQAQKVLREIASNFAEAESFSRSNPEKSREFLSKNKALLEDDSLPLPERQRKEILRQVDGRIYDLYVQAAGPLFLAKADNKAAEKVVDPQRIRQLIEKLGHAKFIERDRAARELEGVGAEALDPLRQAVKSDDAEVSCRAAKLVAMLEHKILTDALLAPKRVHLDLKDVSVLDAVTALAKLGSHPIDIAGDRAVLAERKITLNTGEVSFWEAFEKLCRAGGLVEQVIQPVPPPPVNYSVPVNQPHGLRPLVVSSGAPRELPVCFAGSVRVRAMPAENAGSPVPAGEAHLVLDLSAEMRLQGFGAIGSPVLDKAIDDQGQKLSLAPVALADPLAALDLDVWQGRAGKAVFVNGVVVRRNYAVVNTPPLQRTVTLRLMKGDKATKNLKELTGKVSVQVLSDTEKLASISDVLKSAGQKVTGADGSTMHITSVDKVGGVVTVQLSMANQPGQNMPIRFRGNFNGNFNNNVYGAGSANYPKLHDEQGKVHAPEVTGMRTMINNNGVSHELTLAYRPQGEPTELAFYGQRILIVDVPFALKNVPLP